MKLTDKEIVEAIKIAKQRQDVERARMCLALVESLRPKFPKDEAVLIPREHPTGYIPRGKNSFIDRRVWE
jgi:hypothetical protein